MTPPGSTNTPVSGSFNTGTCLAKAATIIKLLGHPVRLKILTALQQGGRTVKSIWEPLGLRQATVSQQLAILKHLGIIDGRRTGPEMHYSIIDPLAKRIIAMINIAD